jgi:hypothetical protein
MKAAAFLISAMPDSIVINVMAAGLYRSSMGQHNMGITLELVVVITGRDKSQIDATTMICYNCRQYGHRTEGCTNTKSFDLVVQVLQHKGATLVSIVDVLDISPPRVGCCCRIRI